MALNCVRAHARTHIHTRVILRPICVYIYTLYITYLCVSVCMYPDLQQCIPICNDTYTSLSLSLSLSHTHRYNHVENPNSVAGMREYELEKAKMIHAKTVSEV